MRRLFLNIISSKYRLFQLYVAKFHNTNTSHQGWCILRTVQRNYYWVQYLY